MYHRTVKIDLEDKDEIDKETAENILHSKSKKPYQILSTSEKYGLKRLSDTWENRRSRYMKYNTPFVRKQNSVSSQNRIKPNLVSSSPKVHNMSPKIEKKEVRNQEVSIDRKRKLIVHENSDTHEELQEDPSFEYKGTDEECNVNEEETPLKESDIEEVVQEDEKYYLIDSDHPLLDNSPSALRREAKSKDEILQKYEKVLREVNSEFKNWLDRNKTLELRLDEETMKRTVDLNTIKSLKQDIQQLQDDKEKGAWTDNERDAFNKEMASLSYQLKWAKDQEEKWQSERTHLQLAIQNFEDSNKKLRDKEGRSQREINLLLEKLSQRENRDHNYERLVKESNSAKTNYQVIMNFYLVLS